MDELPPMPCFELSIEQQLRLERVRRDIPNASREDLEKMLFEFLKMTVILQNNLSQMFKWAVRHQTKPHSDHSLQDTE
jgi:translation initiation factor 2 beta subunit (eIF-2beta)/eIF-5